MGKLIFLGRAILYSILAEIVEKKFNVPFYSILTLLLIAGISFDILDWKFPPKEQDEGDETEF